MSGASLKEKVGVVTVGAQGIGLGIARRLLEEGMSVVIAEIDEETGREAESRLKHLGRVLFTQTDVGDEESVRKCVALVTREFGRLDALVCNAGIAHAEQSPIETLELKDWNRMISTHLTGHAFFSRSTPHLLDGTL